MITHTEIIARWNAQADEHNQWDELGEDEKLEWAFACGTSAVPAQPTRQELEAQLSAGRGRGGTAAQAPAASAEICVSALMFKISTLIDKRVNCDPCAEAEADLLYFLRTMLAVAPQAVQAAVPVDVEVLRNLITRAISSKTSHHINAAKATFTRDGKKGTALGELVDAIAEDLVAHFAAAPANPAEGAPAQAAALLATGGLAQAVDADSLKLLSDIRAMVESTIKAGLVDDRELLHTFETIAKTAAKAKRPTCAICDSKGFIAFDDKSARGRNGGRWGVCKACTHEAPQAQADARDAERWREAIKHVGAEHRFSADRYVIRGLEAPSNVTRGSVAGHFTKSIDAAIADQAKQGGM